MEPFDLPVSPHFERIIFNANSVTAGASWHTWSKPLNKSYVSITAIGGGGGGGSGAIGANSTAAGGGGGGSGGMTIVDMPLILLPPRLYISVGFGTTGTGVNTLVSTQPDTNAGHTLVMAKGGTVGGNASGATAGSGGTGGGAISVTNMPLGFSFIKSTNSGIAGATGGGGIGGSVNLATLVGSRVAGGAGGGALNSSGSGGFKGGDMSPPGTPPTYILGQSGGAGGSSATTPPGMGLHGFRLTTGQGSYFYYGGTGGGSTHGSATGAGLVQAAGGNGAVGSGGGGSGGALTGSTPAAASLGGPGLVIITCY